MKYLSKPIIYLFCYIYILFKIMTFLLVFALEFIWELNIKTAFNRSHKEMFECFYKSTIFSMEDYRYDTISDFVNGNKNFKNSEFKR